MEGRNPGYPRPSRLSPFGLKVHDRVAGNFLSLARIGKKPVHVVSIGGGKRVLDAPDFLEHQVGALVRFHFFRRVTHGAM